MIVFQEELYQKSPPPPQIIKLELPSLANVGKEQILQELVLWHAM